MGAGVRLTHPQPLIESEEVLGIKVEMPNSHLLTEKLDQQRLLNAAHPSLRIVIETDDGLDKRLTNGSVVCAIHR